MMREQPTYLKIRIRTQVQELYRSSQVANKQATSPDRPGSGVLGSMFDFRHGGAFFRRLEGWKGEHSAVSRGATFTLLLREDNIGPMTYSPLLHP